jgi:hypothetical protein
MQFLHLSRCEQDLSKHVAFEICMFQSQVLAMPHDSLELTIPHPIIAPIFYRHAFENEHKFIMVFIFC